MRRRIIVVICLALSLVFLMTSCGSGSKYVGVWSCSRAVNIAQGEYPSVDVSLDLKSNGSGVLEMEGTSIKVEWTESNDGNGVNILSDDGSLNEDLTYTNNCNGKGDDSLTWMYYGMEFVLIKE